MAAPTSTPVLPSLDAAAVTALVRGEHGDPFALLGPHVDPVTGLISIRCFRPDLAREVPTVGVVDSTSGALVAELTRVHDDGFFAGLVSLDGQGVTALSPDQAAALLAGGPAPAAPPSARAPVTGAPPPAVPSRWPSAGCTPCR